MAVAIQRSRPLKGWFLVRNLKTGLLGINRPKASRMKLEPAEKRGDPSPRVDRQNALKRSELTGHEALKSGEKFLTVFGQ